MTKNIPAMILSLALPFSGVAHSAEPGSSQPVNSDLAPLVSNAEIRDKKPATGNLSNRNSLTLNSLNSPEYNALLFPHYDSFDFPGTQLSFHRVYSTVQPFYSKGSLRFGAMANINVGGSTASDAAYGLVYPNENGLMAYALMADYTFSMSYRIALIATHHDFNVGSDDDNVLSNIGLYFGTSF